MPKFVWEITGRGQWAPQLFHGELPREMTMPHNAHRYVMHSVPAARIQIYERAAAEPDAQLTVLQRLALNYPPPPPFTGKE